MNSNTIFNKIGNRRAQLPAVVAPVIVAPAIVAPAAPAVVAPAVVAPAVVAPAVAAPAVAAPAVAAPVVAAPVVVATAPTVVAATSSNSCIVDYSKFIPDNRSCIKAGWKQQNDDCWLDTFLYCLFVVPEFNEIFSDLLDTLNASREPILKDFAKNVYSYLLGLNDPNWSKMPDRTRDYRDLCKQKLKYKITKNIIGYLTKLFPEDEWMFESTFDIIERAQIVSNGSVNTVLNFFSNISDSICSLNLIGKSISFKNIHQDIETPILSFYDLFTSLKEFTQIQLFQKHRAELNKPILIFNFDALDTETYKGKFPMEDILSLRLATDLNIYLYNLSAILCSPKNSLHYILYYKCNERWYLYDNKREDRDLVIPTEEVYNNSFMNQFESCMLFYKQITIIQKGGNKKNKKNKKSMKHKKSSKKHKKSSKKHKK